MATTKRVVIPYAPRRVFLPFHNRKERFAVGVAHRRCGKTVACINDKIKRAVKTDKEMYRAAYIAPYLKQAKDVAWEYLKKYAAPILARPPNESELWVEVLSASGSPARIRIYGADNAEALRGGYLDDATLDEYADMSPGVWGSIIRPMLADRQGSATFIGTPKGRNAFFEIYDRSRLDPDWFTFFLPASQTGILPQSELSAARLDMTPEQYDQEFECSFDAAILGAYFGRELAAAERAGRLTQVPIVEGFPVHTAWDLGKGQNMPVWCFQIVAGEIRVVDFLQDYNYTIERLASDLNDRGYHGDDWVPHDARAPSLETGRTRIETLFSLKRKPKLVPMHRVDDGINAARVLMPRIWFDAEKCKDGIEALRQYRAEYDEKKLTFKDTPRHDWASHPADAFRYLAMAYREMTPEPPEKEKPLFKPINELTFDELHDLTPSASRERV